VLEDELATAADEQRCSLAGLALSCVMHMLTCRSPLQCFIAWLPLLNPCLLLLLPLLCLALMLTLMLLLPLSLVRLSQLLLLRLLPALLPSLPLPGAPGARAAGRAHPLSGSLGFKARQLPGAHVEDRIHVPPYLGNLDRSRGA
jgi:hypothetical protein